MKRLLLLFWLLISFLGFSQSQNDADLTTQINSTIRGKTFDAKNHANMFKTIVDSKLNLTITANTVFNGGGNTLNFSNGNFDFTPGANSFRIANPAGTFYYTIARSAITGNRTLTLPLLTGNDTFVAAAFSQSLTNKTLGAGTVFSSAPTVNDGLRFIFNPNGTNAGLNIGAHTSAPTSPVDGDFYYNSTGNFIGVRVATKWGKSLYWNDTDKEFILDENDGTNKIYIYSRPDQISKTVSDVAGTTWSSSYIFNRTGHFFDVTDNDTGHNTSVFFEPTIVRFGGSPSFNGLWFQNGDYINFGPTVGALGYGFRNNAGIMEFKNNAGSWTAFGSGGGFTNGAANNELIKSDGTNGVASGIFSTANGSLVFGSGGIAGNRRITTESSDANSNFEILTKGTGFLDLQNTSLGTTYMRLRYVGSDSRVEVAAGIGVFRTNDRGNNATTFDVRMESGDGLPGGTFTNTGNVFVSAGTPFGTGTKGNVVIGSKTAPSNFHGLQGGAYLRNSVASATAGIEEGVVFSAEDAGGFSELYLISERGAKINATGLFEPVQETGTSFTFDYSHLSKLVVGTNAATQTATVPALQVGYITKVLQDGAGVMNLSAGTNVVLVGKTSTTGIGDTIVIHAYKTSGSDTYYLCE